MFSRPVERVTLVLLCLVVLVVLIWLFSVPARAQFQHAPEGKNILVLHALEANMPLNVQTDRAIVAALEAGGVGMKNQFFEYLDLQRNPDSEHRTHLVEMMRLRYGHRKIDMIITLYPEALEFLLKDCRDIFPDAPIVALYMAPGFKLPKTGHRIIQHVFRPDMKGTLEIALKLVPQVKRVYVVGGVHPLDKKNEAQARHDLREWESRLDFRYLSDMSVEDILTEVSSAPRETIIFYMALTIDSNGRTYNPRDVVERLSGVSKASVYGLHETLLGHGIVGGSIVGYASIGTEAGQLALNILRADSYPNKTSAILDVPGVPMFDWKQLRHWNLNEDALPKGSIVINKELTLWDFRYYVILCLALVLAEAALILVLITQRSRKIVAEMALMKAEEKYRNIFESALEGIFETSPQGQLLTANTALARMLGYDSPADVTSSIGDTANQIWSNPNERADYVRLLEQQNVVFGFECQFLRRDGTNFWVSLNTRRVSGPDGQTLFYSGFVEDITERKRTEQALEERLKFETLLADLSARFINLPVDLLDAEIEDVQRRICEWLGLDVSTLWQLPADQPGSLLLTHFYGPKNFPPVPEIMDGKEAFPWCVEKLFRRENVTLSRLTDAPAEAARDLEVWRHYGIKSVLTLPLSAGGGPVYGALSFSTIREEKDWPIELVSRLQLVAEVFANALARRRAEEIIRKSEAKYRRLHESMMDGFVLVGMDGMIREYNESYRQMTGYAPEELSKLTYQDLTPEKWHGFEQKIIEQQVLVRGYSEVYEKEYRKKDGTIFPVELRTFLLKDETRSNSGMWAIVRDITERKRAEDEAHEARRDLARMERLSRMGELTASLSHELSQPLAAILTSAQAAARFLQSDTPDLNIFRTILQNIIQDDKRAAGVITSLRSMMKREERAKEPLNMNTVLDDVLNLFHGEAIVRNVAIERDFDVSLPPVLGDRNQLQQVALNLIMNAAEAMSESIREYEKRKIVLRTRATDHGIQVAVRDFGPGIDAAKLAHIWQPFFTTKDTGLGMGLNVSRSIILAHGGHISAENNPDRGATFYFDLPVAMNSDQ